MNHFPSIKSRVIPLLINDIDTDQIIPARFLKVTDKAGLGANLFADWRYQSDGSPKPDFVLNQESYKGAAVILAGDNFGCGSSREHAPWALAGNGIRAVVSTSFADIFRNNALKNGILPIVVDAGVHRRMGEAAQKPAGLQITVDLQSQTLQLADGTMIHFSIDGFSKSILIDGTDELGYLLKFNDEIAEYERHHE